jgi:hypothetical protein
MYSVAEILRVPECSGVPDRAWPRGGRAEVPQPEDRGSGHVAVEAPPVARPRWAKAGQELVCRA